VEERDKRKYGEQLEPGGREKAPGRLELLQRFINTYNHHFQTDRDGIGNATKAQAWLRANGLIAPGGRISKADAADLRNLREAIRGLAIANHEAVPVPSGAIEVIGAASRTARLRIAVDHQGRTSLAPEDAVAALLGILHEAQLSGDWARMKACRQCEYAFFDRSKNRSATWCAMSICGNRTKNRTYYRRRRESENQVM
jgi:predicted RNA-binding Zn ribbon-like protein